MTPKPFWWDWSSSQALRGMALILVLLSCFFQTGSAQPNGAKNSRLLAALELGYGASWVQRRDSEYQESIWSTRLDFEQDLEAGIVFFDMRLIRYSATIPAETSIGQGLPYQNTGYRFSNPEFLYMTRLLRAPMRVFLGAGLTAPVAGLRQSSIEETRLDTIGYEAAASMHGYRNLWIWLPDTISGLGAFHLEMPLFSSFELIADARTGILSRINERIETMTGRLVSMRARHRFAAQGRLGGKAKLGRQTLSGAICAVRVDGLGTDEKWNVVSAVGKLSWRFSVANLWLRGSRTVSGELDGAFSVLDWAIFLGVEDSL